MSLVEFTRLEPEKCPTCRKIRGGWYDERNRHMATEFNAGVEIYQMAGAYGLANKTVMEIVINELGLMAYQAQSRILRHNALMDREEEE